MLRNLGRLGVIVSLAGMVPACAQNLSSTSQIDLKMLQGGPLPVQTTFRITTSGAWTAQTSDAEVVNLDKTSGSGNSTIATTTTTRNSRASAACFGLVFQFFIS